MHRVMVMILALSGSLRRGSSNTTVLRAAALLAPEGVTISMFEEIGNLPHFNPDLDGIEGSALLDFRRRLQDAHGVIISSPEYAHGVPGSLKNALDWIVGSGELVDKPIALINASPQSSYAFASLMETITVMSGRLVKDACVTLPFWDKGLDAAGVASHPEVAGILATALQNLANAVSHPR
jgi:chromate reductase